MKTPSESFLAGSKWSAGRLATGEELARLLNMLPKLDPAKAQTTQTLNLIEACINMSALEILRFSRTEWGNDYYACVDYLHDITTWLDRYQKAHKFGRYFEL